MSAWASPAARKAPWPTHKFIHTFQKQKNTPTHTPGSAWYMETSHLKSLLLPVCMIIINRSAGWSADLSLARQSCSSEIKLNIPYILFVFTLFSQVFSLCHVLCQPQLYSPKEQSCGVLKQWELGWNNCFRAGVANGLLSWILSPEGLLPLNEIIAINI